jgi:hypothetical protein
LTGALLASVITALALSGEGESSPLIGIEQGESTLGPKVEMPIPDDPVYVPLNIHTGGTWGNPGANPFKGDPYSALRVLGLDKEAAKLITERIALRQPDGEVIFTNNVIKDREGPTRYALRYAMTFGNAVSFGTRTNFAPGAPPQVAAKYMVIINGKVIVIVVPHICGNITRLFTIEELTVITSVAKIIPTPAPLLPSTPAPSLPPIYGGFAPIPMLSSYLAHPIYQAGYAQGLADGKGGESSKGNNVPEPGTAWLILPILGFLYRKAQHDPHHNNR